MSERTVLNEKYEGILERMSIPAEVIEKEGKKFASFGNVVPIHHCSNEEKEKRSAKTVHYCGLFTDDVLAPLEELAYVRVDEHTAEKVFVSRGRRILLLSSDGRVASWCCAPSFESRNLFAGGTPLANRQNQVVSLVLAKFNNYYALPTLECEGGEFVSSHPWQILDLPEGHIAYGDKHFATREDMRNYRETLPLTKEGSEDVRPILWVNKKGAQITLTANNGIEKAHLFLHGVIATGIQYL